MQLVLITAKRLPWGKRGNSGTVLPVTVFFLGAFYSKQSVNNQTTVYLFVSPVFRDKHHLQSIFSFDRTSEATAVFKHKNSYAKPSQELCVLYAI